MFESKYSKVLTVILVIVVIGIVGLLAFLGYDMYQGTANKNEAEAFVGEYEKEVGAVDSDGDDIPDVSTNVLLDTSSTSGENSGGSAGTQKTRPTYNGFGVVGTIKIPAIKLTYPILEETTAAAMENSVTYLFGVGVNEVGNSVISGHNYRNGLFFSNVKNLKEGNQIIITDNAGRTLSYNIYRIFEATPTDTSFYQRDTEGHPEVTLTTCTDDSKMRTIVFARAE